jgi:glycine/D-amino acid oxidase-like deaminating enzyme
MTLERLEIGLTRLTRTKPDRPALSFMALSPDAPDVHSDTPLRADRAVDCAIVGGGVFGCWLALDLVQRGLSVVLFEREKDLLRRASYNNQARVHNGYHYPRSILTGLRSRVNSGRFLVEFADCVDKSFQMYYAIGRQQSNVSAAQFCAFCERIGAPLVRAKDPVAALFDPELIEAVYKAEEWAFDADKLANRLRDRLAEARVDVHLSSEVQRVFKSPDGGGRLSLHVRDASGTALRVDAGHVFNCTYSNLNRLLQASGLPSIPLKQELAEMALVEVPPHMQHVGVTVMCGPFFSFMPFPALGLHTFSHVRYTPHHGWYDMQAGLDNQSYFDRIPKHSNFTYMQRDAQRYMPIVSRFVQKGSLWELKTLLPASESDDSRPILFKRDAALPGLVSVLGGKIDNVYDMEREIDALLVGASA